MQRILVAGFGNTLRGDDGFGVHVAHRLAADATLPADVSVMEVGTAGLRLAQELLTPCDLLIVVDAMQRGGRPGDLYLLEVDGVEAVTRVDMHAAIPSQALAIAKSLGVLPPRVVMVGCEPLEVDELTCDLTDEMSAPVQKAVDEAVMRIHYLVNEAVENDVARR